MSIMPRLHRSDLMFWSSSKDSLDTTDSDDADYERIEIPQAAEPSEPLSLIDDDGAVQSEWDKAWKQLQADEKWVPPSDFHPDTSNSLSTVKELREEVTRKSRQSVENQSGIHLTNGKTVTFRHIYDKIVGYAQNFEVLGDLFVQADPGYAALPWACIRFGISVFASESETWARMLEGTDAISHVIAQYTSMENTYAKIKSIQGDELRSALNRLYKVILRHQMLAITYFDSERKGTRALTGMNPVSANGIKTLLENVEKERNRVQNAIGLVNAEVTKLGFDNVMARTDQVEQSQKDQATITREGILALSQNIGAAFRDQKDFTSDQFKAADERQESRAKWVVESLRQWQEPLSEMNLKLEEDRKRDRREELLRIRAWCSIAEPDENLDDALEKRPMSLGWWLLEYPAFVQWEISVKSSLLWMYGFAGTGKTGLVCRAIEHVERRMEKDQEHGRLAFFFCSSDMAGSHRGESYFRSNPEEVLRSIISQVSISTNQRSIEPSLEVKWHEFGLGSDRQRQLNYEDCIQVLIQIARKVPITILLDAFDELDQTKSPRLLEALKKVMHAAAKKVKIFISTRSFPAIEKELMSNQAIEVNKENNGKDVEAFIRQNLQERVNNKTLLKGEISTDLKSSIETTLTRRAGSMFLYASLLLKQLCDPSREDDEESIRKKLDELPKSLKDVYTNVLNDIHDKNDSSKSRQIAQNTFKWLLSRQGPLDTPSFLEAIAPSQGEASVEDVIRACRTLVIQQRDVFEFAHYSVREHMITMEEYSASRCNVAVTCSCLKILNVAYGPKRARDEMTEAQKSFSRYATQFWPLHFERMRYEDMDGEKSSLNEMLRQFLLQSRGQVDGYVEWLDNAQELVTDQMKDQVFLSLKLEQLRAPAKEKPSPLFAACVFGFPNIIGKFGRTVDGLNRYNGTGQSALSLAIENNKLDVVKTLLTRRYPAEINLLNIKAVWQFESWDDESTTEKQDDPTLAKYQIANHPVLYASALQAAAANGRIEIAEYLISQGAHIDLVAGYYGSPLQAAAQNGHDGMVALLLRNGAEPNSQGGYYGNALQAAAAKGRINIINMLLEHKPPASIDVPGGKHGSALMAAVCSGDSEVVWTLLEEKADPNIRTRHSRTPLGRAAALGPGHKEIVSLLLENGAGVLLHPRNGALHPLHLAAMHGMADLAKYCLDNGSNIEMTTTKGPKHRPPQGMVQFFDFPNEMTPLTLACSEGQVDMVDFLLDRGANFDRPRHTTLWVAAHQGQYAVAKRLIERYRASHNEEQFNKYLNQRPPQNGSGHPMIFVAAMRGDVDVCRLLLESGTRYESNWFEATPILATATYHNPAVAQFLFDHAASTGLDLRFEAKAKNGRNAVYEACDLNEPEILRLLFSHGAAYHQPSGEGKTALHACCHHDNERLAVVSLLISHASKDPDKGRFTSFLNACMNKGRTALSFCAGHDNHQTMDLLLNTYNADYAIPGGAGFTPLHWCLFRNKIRSVHILLEHASKDPTDHGQRFRRFLNHQGSNGASALRDACTQDFPHFVDLLCNKYGATYDQYDGEKLSPLHHAVRSRKPECVRVLLEYAKKDADQGRMKRWLEARNFRDKTAWGIADERNFPRIRQMLRDAGADEVK